MIDLTALQMGRDFPQGLKPNNFDDATMTSKVLRTERQP